MCFRLGFLGWGFLLFAFGVFFGVGVFLFGVCLQSKLLLWCFGWGGFLGGCCCGVRVEWVLPFSSSPPSLSSLPSYE